MAELRLSGSLSPERVNVKLLRSWQIGRAKDGATLGACVVVRRFTTPRDRYACRHL